MSIPFRNDYRLLAALAVTVLVVGCGDSGVEVVPVSGRITFDGGDCPAPGSVSFQPLAPADGLPRRPGRATFDQQGEFIATSYEKGDGLVPGEYLVAVVCEEGEVNPRDPNGWEEISWIEKGYEPEKLVVPPGSGAIELSIDVPKKKNKKPPNPSSTRPPSI